MFYSHVSDVWLCWPGSLVTARIWFSLIRQDGPSKLCHNIQIALSWSYEMEYQWPWQESPSWLLCPASHPTPVLLCLANPWVLVSVLLWQITNKKQLREERNLFHLIILYLSLRESKGRHFTSYPHLRAGRNKFIYTLLPGLSSISLLRSSGPPAKRMEPPTVGWILLTKWLNWGSAT